MNNNEDILDFLDRTENMTPDQAYAESVSSIGRDPGITDEQDAAARTPAPAPAASAPAAPAAPVQPATAIGADGKSHVLYQTADKGRITTASPEYGQLDSTKMMNRMQQGLPAEESQWQSKLAYDRMTLDQRKRLHDSRNGLLADTILRGIAQVNNGGGDIYHNGGKTFRRVKFSGNDENGPVADLNKMRERMGKKGRMGALGVYLEVNADGTPKAGAQPRVWYSQVGADGKGSVKEVADLGTVQEQWAKKYLADNPAKDAEKNEERLRAARRVAAERFGGNYAGWDLTPTAREQYEDKQKAEAEKAELARMQLSQEDKQFYAKLGLSEKQLEENRRQFDQTFGLDQQKHEEAKREFDASLNARQKEAADRLGVQKMEILANVGAKMAQGGKTQDILAALPREFVKSYIEAEVPQVDADGKPILDDVTGAPMLRKPTTEEMRVRFGELKDLAKQAYGAANGSGYVSNLAAQLDGETSAQPVAPTQTPVQGGGAAQASRNVESGLPGLGAMDGNDATQAAQPKDSSGSNGAIAPDAASQNVELARKALERRKQDKAKSREEAQASERNDAIQKYGINETIAQEYDSINEDTMNRFLKSFDGLNYNDIYSGAYDDRLRRFAERIGDESTANVLAGISEKRLDIARENVEADNRRIAEEVESEGIREGWDQKKIDAEIRRRQSEEYQRNLRSAFSAI